MNLIRFQGETPSVYYEFDKDSTPLGVGGMGSIYNGYRVDTVYNMQSVVAIKCINPELVGNQSIIQRAQREASVQVDNPNLIRMYGFFSGAEYNSYTGGYVQSFFLVMEQLVGLNLDQIIFQNMIADKTGQEVDLARDILNTYSENRAKCSVIIMMEIMKGIAALHRAGYIHRDIDPSNVMVTREGNIKVIDFGISKRMDGISLGGGLTQSGQFLGKVAYASPELLLGDLKGQGPCTDIYALGVMLYQLLTGFLPAQGTNQEISDAHLRGKLDYSAITNRALRKVIEKATNKSASSRYSCVEDFMAALAKVDVSDASAQTGRKKTESVAMPTQQPATNPSTGTATTEVRTESGSGTTNVNSSLEIETDSSNASSHAPWWISLLTGIAGCVMGAIVGYVIWLS